MVGLGIFPPLNSKTPAGRGGKSIAGPDRPPGFQGKSLGMKRRSWAVRCRTPSHKAAQREKAGLLTGSKVLSQQGSTGCTNSFANWKQQINQIQANNSKTSPHADNPSQAGSVGHAANSWGEPSGVQRVLYSTPGKGETQPHSTWPGLLSTGEGRAGQQRPREQGWTHCAIRSQGKRLRKRADASWPGTQTATRCKPLRRDRD